MLFGSHIEIWNLANHMKKQNIKHKNVRFIDEKLKTKSLMFFFSLFSRDLQYFKFYYVNPQAFDASFLYWIDFIRYEKRSFDRISVSHFKFLSRSSPK